MALPFLERLEFAEPLPSGVEIDRDRLSVRDDGAGPRPDEGLQVSDFFGVVRHAGYSSQAQGDPVKGS
jgi:hypothetical protein